MSSPIEPTPPLTGPDADRLLESLKRVAAPEVIARRREDARRFLAQVSSQDDRCGAHMKKTHSCARCKKHFGTKIIMVADKSGTRHGYCAGCLKSLTAKAAR